MNFSVIKESDLFYVADAQGEIGDNATNTFGFGLYSKDTRVLSRFNWASSPVKWLPLSADQSGNFEATYKYTNEEFFKDGVRLITRETLLLTRRQFVDGSRFYEEGIIHNFGGEAATLDISYFFDVDFHDMFEVRGWLRAEDVEPVSVTRDRNVSIFEYKATDGVFHRTTVSLSVGADGAFAESSENPRELTRQFTIPPRGEVKWVIAVAVEIGDAAPPNEVPVDSHQAMMGHRDGVVKSYDEWFANTPVVSGDESFRKWYDRGLRDIRMLISDIGYGPFPVAGVPWFAVPFGRDSLITALQMLPINPAVAKGTLLTMAAFQGTEVNPWRDEQPGKIMHELRKGELSRTDKVPFGPYYGSVDSTPLYLNLMADYFDWTGDEETIRSLLPTVEKAFTWIEQYGDRDGDGLVEYFQESSGGIANQGWKDSGDSTVHKDGTLGVAPIALCEVQSYVYRAYDMWSVMYAKFGQEERAKHCQAKAKALRTTFIETFWMDVEDGVALALDKDKRQVQSVSSNMGQVLWGGILPDDLAQRVIKRLLGPDMFSGFGIRTLSSQEVAYNPMSYHNGSVWPHDNSMILAGMQRYRNVHAVSTVAGGLLKTASMFALSRLPELFCGFGVDEVDQPVPYPVSCSPQAWAAATPMLTLQALLGIRPNVPNGNVSLNPTLPVGVDEIRIERLRLGQGELDIHLVRSKNGHTALTLEKNTTGLEVHMVSGS